MKENAITRFLFYSLCKKNFQVFLNIFLLLVTFTVPSSAAGQMPMLSMHFNGSVREALMTIEEKSQFVFIYSDELSKELNERVNINVKKEKLNIILDKILSNNDLEYRINNNQISIIKRKVNRLEETRVSKPAPAPVYYKYRGRVLDKNGDPIIGASIRVKGFQGGYITNQNGEFEINSQNKQLSIVVSYIGYNSKALNVQYDKPITVILEENVGELGQVVVTGFVNKDVKSFTGSQTTLKKDDLMAVGTKNVLTSIQALVPGMNIVDNNTAGSDPNKKPEINIRGRSSFEGAANIPIFVVDGAQVNLDYIYDMDMNDIETVTVLKDASASALYGAKASAGVIVITTKALKGGKLKLNYNGTYRVAIPDLSGYNLLNSKQKLEYERLAGLYTGTSGDEQYRLDQLYADRYQIVRSGVDTDWISMPLRNSFSQNHNLSADGGDENARYNIGIRYGNELGVMKGSERDRIATTFRLSYRKEGKFYVSNSSTISWVKSKESPYGQFSQYTLLNPYDTPYNDNGELRKKLSYEMANPIYEASIGNYDKSEQFYIMNNTELQIWLKKDFRIDGSFSFTKYKNDGHVFTSPYSKTYEKVTDPTLKGQLRETNYKSLTYSGKLMMSYNKNLTDKLYLSTTGGTTIDASDYNQASYQSIGYYSDKLANPSFASRYPVSSSPSGSDAIERSVGFFVNVNTIYNDKYFLDLIYRYEGSSKFGRDKRFAPFWSVGTGWNIHNESFMKHINVQLLKLRASVGYLGNVSFSPYQAMTTYTYNSSYNYVKGIGAVPITIGNPNLKWERTLNTNLGLDLTMFKRRLDLTFDIYSKRTDNLLLDVTKAPSVGVSTARENIGKIDNKGIEIQARVVPIVNKDWNWALSFNYSYNKNKIKSISDALKAQNEKNLNSTGTSPLPIYEEGESLTALKVVPSAGIDPATGKEIYIKKDGTYTFVYDARDKVVFGDQTPYAYGTFGSYLTYKQFSLNLLFGYSLGGLIYNTTLATKVEGSDPRYNADERVFNDRWKQPGDQAKYKDIADHSTPMQTSRFVAVNNFLNLTTCTIAYEFLPQSLKNLGIKRLRLEFLMNDLFHLSSVKQERGTSYPYSRSAELSLRVSF